MPFPAVHPALSRALADQGYAEPTPVQLAVLEGQALDKDLLVSAQTGSGKTVAFGLALGSTLLGADDSLPKPAEPLALIVAPTRELALQVSRELTWLYAKAGAVVATCVGGMDPRQEKRALSFGSHIVVGTPGRLRDHIERGHLDLAWLRAVVLDEADEMLDLGFREDLEFILDAAPADRRTLMFSATIAKPIANLARQYQKDAVRIDTVSRSEPHGDIDYQAIKVAPNEVENAVVNVLRYFESPGALVFCNTREAVRHLYASLRERGFAAVGLSGELSQKERTDALQALRDGHARVCVATDVAARGLDLPDLGLVIHAELPVNKQGLLHRSGRTGRAGRKGVSVLLVPYNRRRRVEQLLDSANIEATWAGPPSAEMIRAGDQKRLLDDPILAEPAAEEDLALARAILEKRSPEDVAAALIRLHRARLPAPEELFDAGTSGVEPRREPRPARDRPEYDRDRAPRSDYAAQDGATWFRMAVGRNDNADPKWLIPLICRHGHVTKKDIGQIRIFDRETKFEITAEAEARFRAAIAEAPRDKVKIEPAGAPSARPQGDKPRFEKPRFEKPKFDGPRTDRPHAKPAYDPTAPKPVRKKPSSRKSNAAPARS